MRPPWACARREREPAGPYQEEVDDGAAHVEVAEKQGVHPNSIDTWLTCAPREKRAEVLPRPSRPWNRDRRNPITRLRRFPPESTISSSSASASPQRWGLHRYEKLLRLIKRLPGRCSNPGDSSEAFLELARASQRDGNGVRRAPRLDAPMMSYQSNSMPTRRSGPTACG